MSDQRTMTEPSLSDQEPRPVSTADLARVADDQRTGQVDRVPESGHPAPGDPSGNGAPLPTAQRTGTAPAANMTNGLGAGEEKRQALFDGNEAGSLRDRWDEIQASFVDLPEEAVKRADALVAEVMQRLAQSFASERASLERQWSSGGEVSTEDHRQALRRYRSFFGRLLSL